MEENFNRNSYHEDYSENTDKDLDGCTGLLNIGAFRRHIQKWLDENREGKYCLMICKIEGFDDIGIGYTFNAFIEFQRELGKFIKSITAGEEFFAGFSEGEIYIFQKGSTGGNAPSELFEKISRTAPYMELYGGGRVRMGVYDLCEEGEFPISIIRKAHLAMQFVANQKYYGVVRYAPNMWNEKKSKLRIVDDFHADLFNGKIKVYYQVQVDYLTKKYIGFESLVRWERTKGNLMSPREFIPFLEKNGLITELDMFVWEESMKAFRDWLDRFGSDFGMSIALNISRLDIYKISVCEILTSLTKKYKIPNERIRLEITESAYTDNPYLLIKTTKELQNVGFIVEMNGFGTMYSSLGMLCNIPVNVLKTDMSFMCSAENSEKSNKIASTIVSMAQDLGIKIIAEGVENKAQADYLLSVGCRYMQGHLFSKTKSEKEIVEMIMGHRDYMINIEE